MQRLPDGEQLREINEAEIESWKFYHDLPVPLAVELGRTKLTARAILELEANSIIQLSRSTGEGVDLIVDQRRIGRGEIIMIEDRTGVRINEVLVPED
ncbi:MAG TPA: FliM/FliN family flagellar motor switch protein [Blastocatellia bacterium]|nr:FliM/FliN family flagellar motor switch protein [Blastocatellia bacterium]